MLKDPDFTLDGTYIDVKTVGSKGLKPHWIYGIQNLLGLYVHVKTNNNFTYELGWIIGFYTISRVTK